MQTEKELKLIPRIETLLVENKELRKGKAEQTENDSLLVENTFLKEQLERLNKSRRKVLRAEEQMNEMHEKIVDLEEENEQLISRRV